MRGAGNTSNTCAVERWPIVFKTRASQSGGCNLWIQYMCHCAAGALAAGKGSNTLMCLLASSTCGRFWKEVGPNS